MQIASKFHTVGNVIRWVVDYSDWLPEGRSLTAADVTSNSATCTVSGVAITEGRQVIFFLNGGVLNEQVVVTLYVTDTDTEQNYDTIAYTVVAA